MKDLGDSRWATRKKVYATGETLEEQVQAAYSLEMKRQAEEIRRRNQPRR
jgi:hypothetical protein